MNYPKNILLFFLITTCNIAFTKVIQITHLDQFEKVLHSSNPSIIKFFKQGCAPCKTIQPLYAQISNKFSTITFYELDADTPELIERYKALQKTLHMYGVPQILFIDNGNARLSAEGSIKNTHDQFSHNLEEQIKLQFNLASSRSNKEKNKKQTPKKQRNRKAKKKKTKKQTCAQGHCE